MTDTAFVITRTFAAPRALVWRTFTEKDLLSRWYGPGVETVIHELDVRPGGVWKNEMRFGENGMFEQMNYTVVNPEERLVWESSMTDSNWQPIANPQMPNWPKTLQAEIEFADDGDGTEIRFTWMPHDASAEEIEVFKSAMDGLGRGWGSGFDTIDEILAELQG